MTRLHKTLNARLDKAVLEYNMLQENDSLLVAISGGADSMALIDLLSLHVWHYANNLTMTAVYIDLGFGDVADERCAKIRTYLDRLRVHHKIVRTDIGPYAHSDANRERPCFLCSRLKRKRLFETAEELGCNKIVFGHHKDDIIETLIINMVWGREISTMIPKLAVFQGRYHVLRPMVYIEEDLIKKYCAERHTPIVDQACPTDGQSKRQFIKEWLNELEGEIKGAKENIFASMKRVKTDYLL
ncbi:tRNA 2-thiocytidine(32) synthetase TtcA [candidate division KSB1 bacterium]|nr:tRNA 2-thiocytidine(32) synthetase TtcA [candidate division KSB1 bacterium]